MSYPVREGRLENCRVQQGAPHILLLAFHPDEPVSPTAYKWALEVPSVRGGPPDREVCSLSRDEVLLF